MMWLGKIENLFAPDIRDHNSLFIPAGFGSLGFIDVHDVGVVGAVALLERHQNTAYSLTGPEALTFPQVAEQFSAVLDRPVRYENPGPFRFFRAMRRRGIPTGMILFMLVEYAATKMKKTGHLTNEVKKQLGRPPISLKRFIADHAAIW